MSENTTAPTATAQTKTPNYMLRRIVTVAIVVALAAATWMWVIPHGSSTPEAKAGAAPTATAPGGEAITTETIAPSPAPTKAPAKAPAKAPSAPTADQIAAKAAGKAVSEADANSAAAWYASHGTWDKYTPLTKGVAAGKIRWAYRTGGATAVFSRLTADGYCYAWVVTGSTRSAVKADPSRKACTDAAIKAAAAATR